LNINTLISKLSVRLLFKGVKWVTVESCTGGLLAKSATDLPGSSEWFESGLVTYSNYAKIRFCNVSEQTLRDYGAVSEQTAREMAQGAAQHFERCIVVAITGIAGPEGGSENKPVGTVCFATYFKRELESVTCYFAGDRAAIREQAALKAAELTLQRLEA